MIMDRSAKKREYYQKNKEIKKAYSRKYYQENKKLIAEKLKKNYHYKRTQMKELSGFQMEFFQ